jgi:hypothetical protein
VVTVRIYVLLFSLIYIFSTFTKSIKLAYNFILSAISCKVARLTIVIAVIALFLVTFAEVIAKLLLRFTLIDYIEVY